MPSRLKSLELNGYKTFAARTVFEFSDRVTTIVGPNGSGKSNIADSLRWVLGEQSYRLLRGKKTEDMIFSGSEYRSRAGMASATITFENSDGWLPIDFNEVAITRRAYRDGQNEYLINGQRVRLKDVSELLSQSGLAERTYTIIGQGLVDAALSLRADERRRLFEEAAGIGLHRSRREEALRRLENTRRNLERIEDILIEIKPRLNSLERQVKRSEEYEVVNKELHHLLREYYGFHWHRSQLELARVDQAAREIAGKLEQIRQKQKNFDQEKQRMQLEIQKSKKGVEGKHQQIENTRVEREKNSRDLMVAIERSHSIKEQLERIEVEKKEIEERLIKQESWVTIAEQERLEIRENLNRALLKKEELQRELELHQIQIESLDKEIGDYQEELHRLQIEREQILAHQHEYGKISDSILNEISKNENLRLKIEQELEQAGEKIRERSQSLQENKAYQNDVEKLVEDNRNQLMKLEEQARRLRERKSEYAQRQTITRVEIEILNQAESALSGYPDGTQAILQAARENRIKGAKGALRNFLEIPGEFETAISAALGVFADSILLESDVEGALDLLEEKGASGIILPLKDIKFERNIPLEADTSLGVLGAAVDFVQAPEELREAVNLLLGNVIIVQDRKAAREVIKRQPTGVYAATKNGDVFHSSGLIVHIGGQSLTKEKRIFNRNKRQKELLAILKEFDENYEITDKKITAVEQRISEENRNKLKLEREKIDSQRRTEISINELNNLQHQFEQQRWQAQYLTEQLTSQKIEIAQIEKEQQNNIKRLLESEDRVTVVQSRIEEIAQSKEKTTFDKLKSDLDENIKNIAVWERAFQDAEKLLEDRKRTLDDLIRTREMVVERTSELSDSLECSDLEIKEKQKYEDELITCYQNLQLDISPVEDVLQNLEKELDKLQLLEENLQREFRDVEPRYTEAQINLARQHESLQSLKNRIEDDFGLVAFDYIDQVSGEYPLPIEDMVEQLPKVELISEDLENSIRIQRGSLRRIGPINAEAREEYKEVKERYEFLTAQVVDLQKAEADMHQVIHELDELMERDFCDTFDKVAEEFRYIFNRLFGGGTAKLILSDPNDVTNTGIEIDARLPGRRVQGLSLLSGGERSLVAMALIFALLKVSPTPFCLFDEVDAMLDEANTKRFGGLLKEMSENTQFVIVTHNRNTVESADVIYGVTMGRDSASKVLSLKLDEISQVID